MTIPTEPVGSGSRPRRLQEAMREFAEGKLSASSLEAISDEAVADTVAQFEATVPPVITDGEQSKSSFATYPMEGLTNLAPDAVIIPFADGHT